MRLLASLIAGLLPLSTLPLSTLPLPAVPLPVPPPPAGPPVVRHLSTAGTVWINATALPSGSLIYNGDTVATAENGFALLTAPEQGRVEIRRDTLVSVAAREITLKGGVVASDGLPVRLGADLVRPAGRGESNPWFVVADRDGQKLVAAYRGSVLVAREGGEPLVIPEGFYAVPSNTPDEKTEADLPGTNPAPPGGGHWAIFSLTSGTAVAFIVSLGATAVFASMVAYTLGQESVSPSN